MTRPYGGDKGCWHVRN